MILAAVVVVAALALLVAFAVLVTAGRREGSDLHRFIEDKREAWERIDAREAALDAREAAMLEREQGLLDRIQAPHMTAAKLLPSGEDADPEFETDAKVDLAFQKQPEAAVQWDADLVPHPFDLTPSDDVAPPTTEPVRP